MWRRLLGGNPANFNALDFSQSVNVILVTFGALVAVSLADFFDETKNKLPDDVRSWALLALLALLLRFIVGSAVHLTRTYSQPWPDYVNSPRIVFFLKDVGFLVAFGVVAIHITHSTHFFHFYQQSALFIAISLLWSLLDAAIHLSGWAGDERRFWVVWVPIDLAQLAITLCLYPLRHQPHVAAILMALIYMPFLAFDLLLTIRVNALK